MVDPAQLAQAVYRQDFQAFHDRCFLEIRPGVRFIPGWRHEHMAMHCNDVLGGSTRFLAVNVPPRSGKSIMASVALPMFALGRNPSMEIMMISHTASLAQEFSVMRRQIAEADWYRQLFPALEFSIKRKMEVKTTSGGGIFSAGTGGAILGKGADLIVLDDPMQGSAAFSEAKRRQFREFYDTTLTTRINQKSSGAILLFMQRLHEADATGHVLNTANFTHVTIPAIETEDREYALSHTPGDVYLRHAGEVLDPEREPLPELERVRQVQGATHFQAQYQQDPAPAGGNIIKRQWLKFYDDAPETFDRVIASWDTASTLGETNDYSVGTVWGSKGLEYFLLDLVRGRFEAPQLRREIVALHQRWRVDVTLIEETELGRALVQDLRYTRTLMPILEPVREGKAARLLAQAARFETGQVYLPRLAPYLGSYMSELLGFPNSGHDDQVDSTSQALKHLSRVASIYHVPRTRPDPPAPRPRPRAPGAPRRPR